MRRSISALGGAVIALTLATGPAWAGTPGEQSVTHSAAVGQIGSIHAGAPVRVASDGNDAPTEGPTGGGGQAASSSAGAVQVGSVAADTPVRVLSDGDASGPAAGDAGGSGDQTVAGSLGVAQVGDPAGERPGRGHR